ncbi:MAG: mechanosensitive ion channel family protein [Paramuribaculum sp.]|nr:mechanosensitive ion channel family protein [Paramuribaculum sp.]
MKKGLSYLILVILLFVFTVDTRAQLIQKAEDIINSVLNDSVADGTDTVSVEERYRQEVERAKSMEQQLQEMKLQQILLRSELDNALNGSRMADSLRMEEQRRSIDSLRMLTQGVPVLVEGDTLFVLYAARGGYSAYDRAEMARDMILKVGSDISLRRDSVSMLDNDGYIDVMYGGRVLVSVTDKDALWMGVPKQELAQRYMTVLSAKINDLRDKHSLWQLIKRAALFLLVIVGQYLLFRLTNYLFRKLRRRIIRFKQNRLRPVFIRDYELLNTRQLGRILIFLSNIVRYLILLLQLTFTVPMLFIIFPQTEALAMRILNYIIEPIKMVFRSIGDYIPNLFIIIVIWLCIRYVIKGLKYISSEIENEKLKIAGFYPDWAQPTFNIVRFLLYAFMIAMIYPYLPGSESGVFQGISVFVGLIVSLGSSTVIGNIIAGLVITYMRPYKVGDRIKLNDTVGNVIEKTPFVTRLRTPKNEVVTIPNSFIMSSHTVNYSASARQYGLIIHTTVTIGYDAPWRQVHQLLINAARSTPGILEHPKPFVLETELQDYYPCYQINAYIKDADNLGPIMSALHQNIQDTFNEAGVEIMSPHYYAGRDGNASTIPEDYLKAD